MALKPNCIEFNIKRLELGGNCRLNVTIYCNLQFLVNKKQQINGDENKLFL